jgi:hypothetical protein
VATSEALSAGADADRSRWWHRHDLLRTRWLWVALWPLGLAAEFAVLWPVLFGAQADAASVSDFVYRVTGGSFIASGLIAWQRRPENRVGALMVAVGFALFVDPLLSQPDASLAKTLALLFADYWSVLFVILLLVFPHGRSPRGRLDRLLVVAFVLPAVILLLAWLLFLEQRRHLLLRTGFTPSRSASTRSASAGDSPPKQRFFPVTLNRSTASATPTTTML